MIVLREVIPPLETGDRLSREEFERRYEAMPPVKKAELIEGVVYMPSPVRVDRHGEQHGHLMGCVTVYRAYTSGVRISDNGTIRFDGESEVQPDAALYMDPAFGGRAAIDDNGYLTGSPEWLAEVSASTASMDLHGKLRLYERHQVQEYVVWRVLDGEIDWFVQRAGGFERLSLTPDGLYQSEVFPGWWLDPAALVRGDLRRVFEVLHQGLASPEHAAFVQRLREAAGPST